MVDTAGCDMAELTTQENISKANEGEAAIVYYHINELVENGVNVDDIAVVTPYNLQVELMRTNMREKYPSLEIKSVDGYQGREKEVVVLSLVRSNQRKEVGFLGETRRLNVAVTRARRQLIVVCDTDTVKNDKFLKEFVEYLEKEGDIRTPDMYDNLPDVNRPDGMIVAEVPKTSKENSEKSSKNESSIKNKSKKEKKMEKSKKLPPKNIEEKQPLKSTVIKKLWKNFQNSAKNMRKF